MKNVHIGVQMMTILPVVEKYGLYEALKKCAETGIHYIEVSQFSMTQENIAIFQRARKELKIYVAAMSAVLEPLSREEFPFAGDIPFDDLKNQFDKIVSDCHAVGCNVLRIGILPLEAVGSLDQALAFSQELDVMAERLKKHGIDLYFHTHPAEFSKYDGKYVLDIIRDHTKNLGFELDTHWIQKGGANPAAIIRRYKGRIRLLHLKDYRVNGRKFAEEGWDADIVEYAEVGEGNLDMKDCVEAGIESGCEYFFIEQDEFYGRDPMESIRISYDNLVAMGYGDYFLPED